MKIIDDKAYAVASKVITTSSAQLLQLSGRKNAAGDMYLQFHDAKALPANGVTPKASFIIYGSAPFQQALSVENMLFANGIVVAVSSTEDTLTISADTVDISYQGRQVFDDTGSSTNGDYTSGTNSLEAWLQAAGPKTLLRAEFTALSDAGSVLYAKLFGSETDVVAGTRPLVQLKLRQNTSEDFFFNFAPEQKIGTNALRKGCFFIIDTTAGGYAADYSGTDYAIKLTYR